MQVVGSFFVLPFSVPDFPRLLVHPWVALGGVLLGIVNAFATLSLYRGFEVGRVSIISPIASTTPVVTILLAVAFLGETVTHERLIGISLAIGGIMLVCIQTEQSGAPSQVLNGVGYAIGFMLLGGLLFYGLKPVSNVLGFFLPVLIMRWVSAAVLSIPFLFGKTRGDRDGALRLIVAVAFFDTFANVAYNLGVSFGAVTVVSTLGGMFSAVTVFLAWSVLKERLTRHQILGFIAIVLGVATLGIFG
jgi:drug/metabolite transporter (DMT)-like permease